MTILLTGGTGKTSTVIATQLSKTSTPYILASRRPAPSTPTHPTTTFDWLDASTYANPFAHPATTSNPIKAIYLVAPEVADPATPMKAFVDYALTTHNVTRFVLMAGSTAEPDRTHQVSPVWAHLISLRRAHGEGLQYTVLRPCWFMENLAGPGPRDTIAHQSLIYTACEDGRIPFVSVEDIAAMAVKALMGEAGDESDYRVLGPEMLTYDDVAATVGRVLGREVKHVRLGDEERERGLVEAGVGEQMAGFLVWLERGSREGKEELTGDDVERVTGRRAKTLEEFVVENKSVWE